MIDATDSNMKGKTMESIQHETLSAASAAGQGQPGTENESVLDVWHVYHLIGDAMRSPELAGRCLDRSFVVGVMRRVERESSNPILDNALGQATAVTTPLGPSSRRSAANDWNWSLVAGVASLAVALAVAWTLGGAWTGREVPQLAQSRPATAPVVTAASRSEPQVMIRDPRLDELLAAHKQLGGTSALQKPAGFLRNAAFEDRSR